MKPTRDKITANASAPARQDWPEPAELGPIRTPLALSPRGLNEPPVRPVPGWRLPSGQLLVEYALRAGLASSPLLVRLPLLGGAWNALGPNAPASSAGTNNAGSGYSVTDSGQGVMAGESRQGEESLAALARHVGRAKAPGVRKSRPAGRVASKTGGRS